MLEVTLKCQCGLRATIKVEPFERRDAVEQAELRGGYHELTAREPRKHAVTVEVSK